MMAPISASQHVAQMDGMQRRLAHQQHELAALLQHDVGGRVSRLS